jgi:hypothetical protein
MSLPNAGRKMSNSDLAGGGLGSSLLDLSSVLKDVSMVSN